MTVPSEGPLSFWGVHHALFVLTQMGLRPIITVIKRYGLEFHKKTERPVRRSWLPILCSISI